MSDDTTRIIRRKPLGFPESPALSETPPPIPPMIPPSFADDDKTRIYRAPQAPESPAAPPIATATPVAPAPPIGDDLGPTAGWLVILEGPGRGTSLTLGYGMNHAGRSATNRLLLDYGDEEISRKIHTTFTYDPRGRKFYVQPGPETTNLTYLGVEPDLSPILVPVELHGGEVVTLGRTKLKFFPLCGPDFTWK